MSLPRRALLSSLSGGSLLAVLAAWSLLPSCASSSLDTEIIPPKTAILLDPSAFLSSEQCATQPGSPQFYQATLLDITEGLDNAVPGPSSALLNCRTTAYFEQVEAGHLYIAKVEAYDQSGLIVPQPGVALVQDEKGEVVSPKFTTTCWGYDEVLADGWGGAGNEIPQAEYGIEAQADSRIYVRGCAPLTNLGEPGPTGVTLKIQPERSGLLCGEKPGQIHRFIARTSDSEDPVEELSTGGAGGVGGAGGNEPEEPTEEPLEFLCGESVELLELPAHTQLKWQVEAWEQGAEEPSWGTSCQALTVPGQVVSARCELLSNWVSAND